MPCTCTCLTLARGQGPQGCPQIWEWPLPGNPRLLAIPMLRKETKLRGGCYLPEFLESHLGSLEGSPILELDAASHMRLL